MGTTSDFTQDWSPSGGIPTKFVAERLLEHPGPLPAELQNDAYYQAIKDARRSSRSSDLWNLIREYWRDSAQTAERESRPFDAYRDYYYAGWDVHVYNDMDVLLEGMVRSARSAESKPLTSLAEFHLSNTT